MGKRDPTDIATGGLSKRLVGKVSTATYQAAVQQAVDLWTPLLGSALPPWARPANTSAHLRALESREAARDALLRGELALPGADRHPSDLMQMARSYAVPYDALRPALPHPFDRVPPPPPVVEKSVLYSKQMLRTLLRRENEQHQVRGLWAVSC
jgi:hypothetical protein